MTTSKWHFSFWPVLAFVCVLPGLLWLGAWQVQRGIEKAQAHDAFAKAALGEASDVTGLSLNEFNTLPRYRRIKLRGRYLERHFLLDNMSHAGRPGHHVLTPFAPDGASHVVIVDRGWRRGLARDAQAGNLAVDDVHAVTGILAPLPRPALQLNGKPVYEGWPRVVQFPDAQDMTGMLNRPVAEPRLLLNADAVEGFTREWSAPGIPPARHYAYAFQWFGLAAALIVIFVVMARPRRSKESEE